MCRLSSRSTSCFFFFNDTATTAIYTLSLHDALPIFLVVAWWFGGEEKREQACRGRGAGGDARFPRRLFQPVRSEEHTSELQSQSNLVCRLLLEKKKK